MDRLQLIEAALGGRLGGWGHGETFTERELKLAGQWIRARRSVAGRPDSIQRAVQLLAEHLGNAQDAVESLAAVEREIAEVVAPT